ncbi:unnamed protein product [Zymoseptoria tritici ST99CH_1A5]|uniref:Mid2 domain-containing protein n=1 Tax=Zymoseptoria tritici ST99CH_1A5 TaxID=1276529 RepID=A0A1Y6LDM9_ZYMTR|nr:unnamed protein product [Zymoseptoria tritici ST99CH_1A5]
MRPRSLLAFDSCTALFLAFFSFSDPATAQSPWWNPAAVDSPANAEVPAAAGSWNTEVASAQVTAAASLQSQYTLPASLTASWQTWETWSHWSPTSATPTPTPTRSTWSRSSTLPSSTTAASSSSSSSSSSTLTKPTSSPTHTVMAKGSQTSEPADTRNKYSFSDKGLAILIGVIIIGAAAALLAAALILVHLRKKYTGSYFKAPPGSMHSSMNGGSEGDAESLHNEKTAAQGGVLQDSGAQDGAAQERAARDEAAHGGPWFGGMLHHQTSQNSFSNSVLAAASRVSTPDPARLAHQESQKVLIQEDHVVEDGLHPVERPVSRASYTEADNLLTAAGRPQELEGGGGGAAHTPASELDGAREVPPETAAAAAAAAIAANTNHSSPDYPNYPASHNPHDSSAWPQDRASTPLTAVPVHGNVANNVSAHTYPPYHPVSSSHAPLQEAPSTHDLPLLPSTAFVPPPRPQSRPLVVMQSPTSTTSSERYSALLAPNPNGRGTMPYNLDDADVETNFTCDSTTNLQTPHASFWNRDRWIVPPNPNSPSYLNDTRHRGGVSPLPGRETFNSSPGTPSPGTPGYPNGYPRQSSPLLHQRANGGYRDISPSSSEFLPTPRPDQPRPDRSRREGKAAVLCPTWGELSGFDFDGAAVVERTGEEGEDGEDGWRPAEAADGRYELM